LFEQNQRTLIWKQKGKVMIKYLFLLWIPFAQAAGVIAEGRYQNITISLTDSPCSTMPNTKVAYQYKSNGHTILGCWAADQSRVFVAWNDLTMTSYSYDFFNQKGLK
jgi:hypothetical protein